MCVCVCVCVYVCVLVLGGCLSAILPQERTMPVTSSAVVRHATFQRQTTSLLWNQIALIGDGCPDLWQHKACVYARVCTRACVCVCVCVCVCAQVLVAGASMHARAKMHVFLEWLGWQYKSIWLHNESRNNAHLTDVKYSTRPLNWTRWRTTVLPSWMKGQKFVFQRCM